jgi:hypothetical protein
VWNAESVPVKRRLGGCRLEVADPLHLLAVVVEEGIDVEVAEQGVSPVQARRARSLFLTQQKKNGRRCCPFRSGCSQTEIAHGVPVPIQDMLREQSAGKRVGIESLGWHNFRYTYRKMLKDLDTPIEVPQKLMRHASMTRP